MNFLKFTWAQVLQVGTVQAHDLCLKLATTRAARKIGLAGGAIAPNNTADRVILDAIAFLPPTRTVQIKRPSL
ncbi:hypothetical protein [Thermoleptolyngbya sp.]